MQYHKYQPGKESKWGAWTICGREVNTNRVVIDPKNVTCKHCKRKFAAMLRALPDVVPQAK